MLVNNAGIQRVALTDEFDPATWESVIAVHLLGGVPLGTPGAGHDAAAAVGRDRKVASVAGLIAIPGRGPYSAAKAG